MPTPSRRKRRRVIFGGLLAAYALTMIFGGCADRLLLYPTTGPIAADGAVAHRLPFAGGNLEIWVQQSPHPKSKDVEIFVVEFCGNATRAEQIVNLAAWRWRQKAAEVWVVNTPGFGGSTGPARLAVIAPAALVAYDEVARHAQGRRIFIAGNSLGTAAAMYVAAHRPVAGLLLQNPPPLRTLILRRHGWWNLWLLAGPVALQVPKELSSLTNAPQAQAPALFLLADHDEIVPPPYHQMVVDAYAGPKRVIDLIGATHNDGPSDADEATVQAGIAWLLAGGDGAKN